MVVILPLEVGDPARPLPYASASRSSLVLVRRRFQGNARHIDFMGHSRHRGLRAIHTVAPKSMSAWLKSKTWRWGTRVSANCQSWRRVRVGLGVAAGR